VNTLHFITRLPTRTLLSRNHILRTSFWIIVITLVVFLDLKADGTYYLATYGWEYIAKGLLLAIAMSVASWGSLHSKWRLPFIVAGLAIAIQMGISMIWNVGLLADHAEYNPHGIMASFTAVALSTIYSMMVSIPWMCWKTRNNPT